MIQGLCWFWCMILRVLLVVAIVLKLAGAAGADIYTGLVVPPDYKKLPIRVAVITDDNTFTKEEILRAVKLRLMANNITPLDWKPDVGEYLYVEFMAMSKGSPYRLDVYLRKKSNNYVQDSHLLGSVITPEQGSYGRLATGTKSFALESLNGSLDDFLLDYLESNMWMQKNLEEFRKHPKKFEETDKSSK